MIRIERRGEGVEGGVKVRKRISWRVERRRSVGRHGHDCRRLQGPCGALFQDVLVLDLGLSMFWSQA